MVLRSATLPVELTRDRTEYRLSTSVTSSPVSLHTRLPSRKDVVGCGGDTRGDFVGGVHGGDGVGDGVGDGDGDGDGDGVGDGGSFGEVGGVPPGLDEKWTHDSSELELAAGDPWRSS